ncbi:MAG: helix-turn-helix domain-containing protein [Clostridiales bacterium]|nr:helix-turn-helix domain-containing protein [Clostridiales bacterium]MCF8023390.1 helix-turn-helix domain-containing protein [Clostridiales bacterium]
MRKSTRSRVPWSAEPSLERMTEEIGVNFNEFVDAVKNKKSDAEMANEFNVSEKTITNLREHFMHKGVGSIMGQD